MGINKERPRSSIEMEKVASNLYTNRDYKYIGFFLNVHRNLAFREFGIFIFSHIKAKYFSIAGLWFNILTQRGGKRNKQKSDKPIWGGYKCFRLLSYLFSYSDRIMENINFYKPIL